MAKGVGDHSAPAPSLTRSRVASSPDSCLLNSLHSLALPSRSLEPAEEPVQTRLHRLLNPTFYGYQDAPWRIFLRKEVPGARKEAEWGPKGPPSLDQRGRAEPEDPWLV